jgi:phosphohistidine phosphatase SixA
MKITKALVVLFFLAIVLPACRDRLANTVYLVRHAEKELSDTTDNPPLTAEGKARAGRLKELLSKEKITAIYSTGYDRTLQTVQPLAAAKGITIRSYEWNGWQPVIDEVMAGKAGKTYLICGHSDNLLPMITYMKGKLPQDSIGSNEYDKIFKIETGRDSSRVSVLHY